MSINKVVSVIDDNIEILQTMRFLLETESFKVKTFASADLFLLSKEMYQSGCIIIDVRMPGLSGLELLEHLIKIKYTSL